MDLQCTIIFQIRFAQNGTMCDVILKKFYLGTGQLKPLPKPYLPNHPHFTSEIKFMHTLEKLNETILVAISAININQKSKWITMPWFDYWIVIHSGEKFSYFDIKNSKIKMYTFLVGASPQTGLPTVPIFAWQSQFLASCTGRIFASNWTIECPDFTIL